MRQHEAEEEFKRMFKVGDIVTRCSTSGKRNGSPMKITAIGVKRFLFVSLSCNRNESVAMIHSYGSRWVKWDESKWPDSQYIYILERKREPWDLLGV